MFREIYSKLTHNNIIFLPILASKTSVKIYDPCELAKDMAEKYRFPSSEIADCKLPAL
jgi:hypothetical protein